MNRSNGTLLLAIVASAVVFGIGSLMPYWIVVKPEEKWGHKEVWEPHRTSFWGWLTTEESMWSARYYNHNQRDCAILFAATIVVGLGVYWPLARRHRPEEARDYADGPTGITTDGRVITADRSID